MDEGVQQRCDALSGENVPGMPQADAFSRLSGMPAAYFERMAQANPDADLGALRVFLALRAAARRIDNAVAHWLDSHDLTVTKMDVLHLVAASERGTTVARMREFLLMTQPNVAFVVSALVRDGLLRRSADPSDGRSVLVHLTPAGRRLLAAITGGQLSALGRSLAVLDKRERELFIDMLARLTECFERTEPPP